MLMLSVDIYQKANGFGKNNKINRTVAHKRYSAVQTIGGSYVRFKNQFSRRGRSKRAN